MEKFKRLLNPLIYKAYAEIPKASSILASPFNPLAYKALSVLLKACPYTFFRPFGRICLENLVVSRRTSRRKEKLSTLLRQISWTNNLTIMSRTKSAEERLFYLHLCVRERLSTRQLNRQIDSALYERDAVGGAKLSSMLREIAPQAEHIFRDQYVLEFIGGKEYEHENSMKAALIKQMKQFILELGKDFLFIDEEFRLQVGNSDFRIDLLFYHRELQCLVAFELKMEKFKPEHLGQLNFYLEALDRDVKKTKENPSIGVLLCKDKDDSVVEYALSRSLSPTMVAEYQLRLPDKALLQKKLRDIYEQDLQDE